MPPLYQEIACEDSSAWEIEEEEEEEEVNPNTHKKKVNPKKHKKEVNSNTHEVEKVVILNTHSEAAASSGGRGGTQSAQVLLEVGSKYDADRYDDPTSTDAVHNIHKHVQVQISKGLVATNGKSELLPEDDTYLSSTSPNSKHITVIAAGDIKRIGS